MSELPYVLTSDLKMKLAALGWYEGRKVDIAADLEAVRRSGWIPFPIAITFTEQFDGLGNRSDYFMDVLDAGTNWKYGHASAEAEARNGSRLFPVGVWNGWVQVVMSETGCIYGFVDDETQTALASDAQSDFETLIDAMYHVHISNQKRIEQ